MRKSPGKWIKTVLFGKKNSKPNLSKAAAKSPVENQAGKSSVITGLPHQLTDQNAENIEIVNGSSSALCDATHLNTGNQSLDSQSNIPVSADDGEMRRQEYAATIAQAAFRGYMARRAFWALKGIIRLQALIRGHLVRRQAVATFRCMQAIVKIQALVRGQRVRFSDSRPEELKKYNVAKLQVPKQVDVGETSFLGSEKLATNTYIHKLLGMLPTAMPLSLHYNLADPNSAWNWLERWSLGHLREPPALVKNSLNVKPQKKQGGTQVGETLAGKSKRSIRKVSTTVNGAGGALASVEIDKPTRNSSKVTSHQGDPVQELPQSELERIKHNLRKVSASASAAAASEKPEMEVKKLQALQSTKPVFTSGTADIPSEKPTNPHVQADELFSVVAPSTTIIANETVDVSHDDHPVVELHSLDYGGKIDSSLTLNEESSVKGELSGKSNQKIKKRRSLPVKPEYPENITQNNPSLPSYMAATESAKAKLRAQGSTKFDEDGAEYGYVRRHSLPASTNGKLSSMSPRVQKPVQANGKGGTKPNRSLTTSRDDKVLQPGWRR